MHAILNKVTIKYEIYNAMAYIGKRPTINHGLELRVEANIFDFNEEAYGKPLTLAWYKFIRKNKKFSGIEDLSHQLDQDKCDIKQYFYKLKN